MDYDFIQEYCLAKPGTEEDYKVEWDAIRYRVCEKIYAMVGNDPAGEPIISMKLNPEYSLELRERYYPDIIPGYHLNKQHWSSLYLKGNVPEVVLKQMLDQAHELIVAGLNKTLRERLR